MEVMRHCSGGDFANNRPPPLELRTLNLMDHFVNEIGLEALLNEPFRQLSLIDQFEEQFIHFRISKAQLCLIRLASPEVRSGLLSQNGVWNPQVGCQLKDVSLV